MNDRESNSYPSGMRSRRHTQLSRLRSHFRTHPKEWISLPDLHELSGSLNVSVRVADLRREGMDIENRVTRSSECGEMVVHSEYRYWPNREDGVSGLTPHEGRAKRSATQKS